MKKTEFKLGDWLKVIRVDQKTGEHEWWNGFVTLVSKQEVKINLSSENLNIPMDYSVNPNWDQINGIFPSIEDYEKLDCPFGRWESAEGAKEFYRVKFSHNQMAFYLISRI